MQFGSSCCKGSPEGKVGNISILAQPQARMAHWGFVLWMGSTGVFTRKVACYFFNLAIEESKGLRVLSGEAHPG